MINIITLILIMFTILFNLLWNLLFSSKTKKEDKTDSNNDKTIVYNVSESENDSLIEKEITNLGPKLVSEKDPDFEVKRRLTIIHPDHLEEDYIPDDDYSVNCSIIMNNQNLYLEQNTPEYKLSDIEFELSSSNLDDNNSYIYKNISNHKMKRMCDYISTPDSDQTYIHNVKKST